MGNTAQQCRLGLFQGSDFARYFEDSKQISWRILYVFGRHTFLPTSWMCKKQTSQNLKLLRMDEVPLSISGIWLLKCCILPSIKHTDTMSKRRETCSVTNRGANTPTPKSILKFTTMILSYPMSIMFPRT